MIFSGSVSSLLAQGLAGGGSATCDQSFATAAALAGSVGMASADALLAVADKSIPTVVGLAAIPFIVHPIDNAIHALLNVTLRPALKKFVCEQGKGKEAGLELCEECGPWTRPNTGGKKAGKH